MDFNEGLPESEGKEVIYFCGGHTYQVLPFCRVSHPYTAYSMSRIFMDHIYKLHGLPESIISDRDSISLSNFRQELFKLLGTELNMSTAYHTQIDGQTERVNACLETYLRCMVGHKPKC